MTPEQALQKLAEVEGAMTAAPWVFGDGRVWDSADLVAPSVIERWEPDELDPTAQLEHAKCIGNHERLGRGGRRRHRDAA